MRVNFEADNQTLSELVESYGYNHSQAKYYKDHTDELNTRIKNIMAEEDLTECSSDSYKVTRIVTTRRKFDERKLIKVLLNHDNLALHAKWEIDYDELESYLYNIADAELAVEIANCAIVTEISVLRIKEIQK